MERASSEFGFAGGESLVAGCGLCSAVKLLTCVRAGVATEVQSRRLAYILERPHALRQMDPKSEDIKLMRKDLALLDIVMKLITLTRS